MKTINDVNFKGKKVLIRVDYNVPLNHNRQITDDTRIRESLSTIKKILEDGASVILMSHLGRPKGGYEEDYSLSPIVPVLTKYLSKNIIFSRDLFGDKTKEVCSKLKPGDVVLLENLRFYPEEEKGDVKFAKELSSIADYYVNDAFATSHRNHASVATIAQFFPNKKYFGLLLANEIENLNKVLNNATPPFTAIIGGAKISTKLPIIKNLLNRVDNLIIGGGMAFTFIKALGGKIGGSMIEQDKIEDAKEIVTEVMLKGINLYIPTDAILADNFTDDANIREGVAENISDGWIGLDIGKKTCRRYAEIINKSQTILWNGPMGVFEMSHFKQGTKAIAIAVASATISGSYSLVGGGDSVAAINMYNLADQISYVSTGGGAMLEYIEGKELPGIKALLK
ncbi:MAG: phosphoglycerate kinase [Bacteroidales bacterium]|nr:phosphoglycerate kinase [Bacteroidales bacterium]